MRFLGVNFPLPLKGNFPRLKKMEDYEDDDGHDDVFDNTGSDDDAQQEEDIISDDDEDKDNLYTTSATHSASERKTLAQLYDELCQYRGNFGLTKFEKIAVIKRRAKEIETGKKNTILPKDILDTMPIQNRIDPVRLAMKEFELNLFNMKIGRTFSDGSVKYYNLSELRKIQVANTFEKRLPLGGLPC